MNQPIYDMSEREWAEHAAHRRRCGLGGGLCDHPAHHYTKAFDEGRVRVAGTPVDVDGRPIPPGREPEAVDGDLLRRALEAGDPMHGKAVLPFTQKPAEMREHVDRQPRE